MAGMKRFVTYIYTYEEKKKGANTGFAKIEIRGEDCRIEIHLRGAYMRQAVGRVYLFREVSGVIEGVLIGELRLLNGMGDCSIRMNAGKIGESTYGISDMEGIFVLTEDAHIFMSRWKEGKPLVVSRENFREWKPQEHGTEAKAVPPVPKEPEGGVESEQSAPDGDAAWHEPPEALPEPEAERDGEETDVQATEIPMRNIFPVCDWQDAWERLLKSHPLHHPFLCAETACVQIELKHLRELPKNCWYLGNNSFLLHGFFNYHYLVVGKTEQDRWFIGVPGIYQRQERVMAAIFGFPDFLVTAQDAEKETHETCEEPVNRFGCWCRYIEE